METSDWVIEDTIEEIETARDVEGHELAMTQEAWETYRDAQCDLEADRFRGGSAEDLVRLDCRLRMADLRQEELDSLPLE